MGSVYVRGNKLWLAFKDAEGVRQLRPSGLEVGDEPKARELLDIIEARVRAGAELMGADGGPVTLRQYAGRWLKERERQGVITAVDEVGRVNNHILPILGDVVLDELRPRHVRDLVRALRRKASARGTPMAPKTVRATYGVLRRMLHDAEIDELIRANPCKLKHGELPAKVDADPEWRAGAIFSRDELELLLSSESAPEDRRMMYAIMFLAGLRFGEASALRWRSYDADAQPLGRLQVAKSYSTRKRREKGTKTHRARQVPVHPTLAKVIAEWKLGGFERTMGRKPEGDDLIVPSREGRNRSSNHMLRKFHEDLERIGLRTRRQHDARRTFTSLALADGARRDILRWVTHGSSGDVMDGYTTLPWTALCEAVACIRVTLREGKLVSMPARLAAAAGGGDTPEPATAVATVHRPKTKNPEISRPQGFVCGRGGRDLNPRPPA